MCKTFGNIKDIIKGDFNNDSKYDFAVLVKPYKNESGFLVVLLEKDSTYDLLKLEEVSFNKEMVLFLSKKGSKEYDFASESYFEAPSEGIDLEWFEKAGHTYYMINGNFVARATSD